jgi:hypothetical protein
MCSRTNIMHHSDGKALISGSHTLAVKTGQKQVHNVRKFEVFEFIIKPYFIHKYD